MKQILNSHYFLNEDNEIVNSKYGKILKGSIASYSRSLLPRT